MRLREARKRAGLTQAELASKIGIGQNTYSYWETGKTKIDNVSLAKLAEILGVSIDYIMGHDIYEPEKKDYEEISRHKESSFVLSPEEILHIKKYRTLDDVGKSVVDAVLETQVQRIAEKQGLSSDKAI